MRAQLLIPDEPGMDEGFCRTVCRACQSSMSARQQHHGSGYAREIGLTECEELRLAA